MLKLTNTHSVKVPKDIEPTNKDKILKNYDFKK